jgi:hypothetical protein
MNCGDVAGILVTGGVLLVCSPSVCRYIEIPFTKFYIETYLCTLETSARSLSLDMSSSNEFIKLNNTLLEFY